WNGATVEGKTLLLIAEQGLGDTIQFVRYIPRLESMGLRVILAAAPALHALLETASGNARIVSNAEPLPPADFHLPLLSLPQVLNDTLETLPRDVPYLRSDLARGQIFQPDIAPEALN